MRRLSTALAALPVLLWADIAAAQDKVFVIRHAEQELSAANPSLTNEGQERAAEVASMLRDAEIDVVFASSTLRTQQTGNIIATSLGVSSHEFPKYSYAEMIEKVRTSHADETVLIVGNSGTIPAILKLLGVIEPVTVSKSDYDNLFLVVPNGNGSSELVRLRMP